MLLSDNLNVLLQIEIEIEIETIIKDYIVFYGKKQVRVQFPIWKLVASFNSLMLLFYFYYLLV
jgi:hypothetical protein